MTKSASKAAARKTRHANPKTPSKGKGKAGNKHKPAAKVAAEMVRNTHRKTTALSEQFPVAQVPDTFRVLAERNVASTRELYEGSKNTLQAEAGRNHSARLVRVPRCSIVGSSTLLSATAIPASISRRA